MDFWNRLPEWLRWLLYFPAVLVTVLVFQLFTRFCYSWTGQTGALAEISISLAMGVAWVAIASELAPRGKVFFAWAAYLIDVVLFGGFLLLMVVRALSLAGLIRRLAPAAGEAWTHVDTVGLFQLIAGLLGSTMGLRFSIRDHKRAT